EAGLALVAQSEVPDSLLGVRPAAGPLGKLAQVDQQGDGAVVVVGALGGDQVVDLAPGRGLAAGEVVERLGSGLGLLSRETLSLPGRALGGLSPLVLDQGVVGREQ